MYLHSAAASLRESSPGLFDGGAVKELSPIPPRKSAPESLIAG